MFKRWINNRVLAQRDASRRAGDLLAAAIWKTDDPELKKYVIDYCKSQGWGGPAMSWLKKLEDQCTLCSGSLSIFRLDKINLCKNCKINPKI